MTESASRSADNDPRFLAPLREGQTVAGKYVVGRTLGVGGMGIVYAARDARLDRQVAIKVLLPRLVTSQTATQRFMREARAATRITSEHVVKLLEIDTLPDGTPLLVMEYLEGRDLRAVLREDGPLPPRLAIDYLLQALQAVAEGHMQTIVHRDLKPSNLFLTTRADGTPLIKVLDFGIAKTLEPEASDTFALTSSEDVRLGSPTYMPPEQLQNPRDVDMRSDIWALGVTLHELVSGSPPFQGQTYAELLTRILAAPPESLKSRIPELTLPEGLSEIVGKCLEKKREARYSNAAELATALAPFGSDDARLSLYRVTGLTRAPVSPRPASSGPATIVGDALPSCDTTLPVPVDAALGPAEAMPESGARPVLGPVLVDSPPRSRAGLIGGAALAAVVVGVIWHQASSRELPQGTPTTAPSAVVSQVSALPTGAVATNPSAAVAATVTAPSAPPPDVVTSPGAPAPSAQIATKVPPVANAAPAKSAQRRSGPTALRLMAALPSEPEARPSAKPAETASASPAPASEASELGPSPLIEKLIEERH